MSSLVVDHMTVASFAVADSVVLAVEDLVRREPVDAEHARPPRRVLPLARRLVPRLVRGSVYVRG